MNKYRKIMDIKTHIEDDCDNEGDFVVKLRKVMVLGASGYIGSHVCKQLKKDGDFVIGIDHKRSKTAVRFMDIFLEADYGSERGANIIKMHNDIDCVVHCGGMKSEPMAYIDPQSYYENMIGKTLNVLTTLRCLPTPPPMVYASSISVQNKSPLGETHEMIETVLKRHTESYDTTNIVLRISNVAGADLGGSELGIGNSVINHIVSAVKNKTEFRQYGDMNKDYIHVNDVAMAVSESVKYCFSRNKPEFCIMNIQSGNLTKTSVLLDICKKIGEIKSTLIPPRFGDFECSVPEIKNPIKWEAIHGMDTITQSVWRYNETKRKDSKNTDVNNQDSMDFADNSDDFYMV